MHKTHMKYIFYTHIYVFGIHMHMQTHNICISKIIKIETMNSKEQKDILES